MNSRVAVVLVLLGSAMAGSLQAGWGELLDRVLREPPVETADPETPAGPDPQEQADALRQALYQATTMAVAHLGREDGFLADPQVRIPIPESLNWAVKGLRSLGQDEQVDVFQRSLNRAAEQAMPQVLTVLHEVIAALKLADAEVILEGPYDAATQHLELTSGDELSARIRPIVSNATRNTLVTHYYLAILEKAGFMGQFVPADATDLDGHVTRHTLEGLFHRLALEEKRIRNDRVAHGSELMRRVFSDYRP